jgi:hypothetical protein
LLAHPAGEYYRRNSATNCRVAARAVIISNRSANIWQSSSNLSSAAGYYLAAIFSYLLEVIMPEPREHAKNRGWFESILRRIPGFKGYLEKEYRRDSDALQRNWLADRLQRSKRSLDVYSRALVDAVKLDAVAQVDRFKGRMDRSISRLRGAMPGYSGFFDLVQVDEARLECVYEHDVKMMDAVDALGDSIDQVEHATADIAPPIQQWNDQLAIVEQAIDHRQDILKGLE